MRKLPERPGGLSRHKFTVSIPGEIEPEFWQRLERLQMTPQQHYESMLAFDMLLEKAHIITGDCVRSKAEAWILWREVIAEFGNPQKDLTAYTEHFLERLMQRLGKTD